MTKKLIPAKPRSSANIEKDALGIIKEFQPEVLTKNSPFDVELFFDCDLEKQTGVNTDYQRLDFGVYGYTDSESMISVISLDLVNNGSQENFRRSTIAHEIGHAFLHVNDYKERRAILRSMHRQNHQMRSYREEEIITYENPEWQAWCFAGALLMPATVIQKLNSKGYTVSDMSEILRVNPAFMQTRLRSLKLKNK